MAHPGVNRSREWLGRYGVWVWGVLLALFTGLFIFNQSDSFGEYASVLGSSSLGWVGVALLFQAIVISLFAASYYVVLRRLGHGISIWQTIRLHLERVVVSTVTPMGGPASVVVFLRSLKNQGVPADDGFLTMAFRSISAFSSFVILFVPVIFLVDTSLPVILGSLTLVVGLVLLTAVLVALLRGWELPIWALRFMPSRIQVFIEQARSHNIRGRDLILPMLFGTLSNIAGVATLYVALLAVGFQPTLVMAVFAYTIGTVMLVVSPLFQGVGLVEVGMAVALEQMGVPVGAAVGATLLFRLADIWLPLLVGFAVQAFSHREVRLVSSYAGSAVAGAAGIGAFVLAFVPSALISLGALLGFAIVFSAGLATTIAFLSGMILLGAAYLIWRFRPRTQLAHATA